MMMMTLLSCQINTSNSVESPQLIIGGGGTPNYNYLTE